MHLSKLGDLMFNSLSVLQHITIVSFSCSLNAAQVQSVTVCGEDFVLKSCITQKETSRQALFTSISLHGVNKQFEDAQVHL